MKGVLNPRAPVSRVSIKSLSSSFDISIKALECNDLSTAKQQKNLRHLNLIVSVHPPLDPIRLVVMKDSQ